MRPHLTFANVMSSIAVFVALGGTSVAAVSLKKNSVGNKAIKKGAVTNSKLGRNAVTSTKVKNRSLLAGDFKRGQLPRGATGPTGASGPQGPAGAAGATSIVVRTNEIALGTSGSGAVNVHCNAGERATGGGGVFVNSTTRETSFVSGDEIHANGPVSAANAAPAPGQTATGWNVGYSYTAGGGRTLVRSVVCVRP